MRDIRRKFFKLKIPYFIKNSLVEVYEHKRKSEFSNIRMEVIPGSKL
jgi:hypothetical protein